MSWKNRPSWFRGGLVGIVAAIILLILALLPIFTPGRYISYNYLAALVLLLATPFIYIATLITGCSGEGCMGLVYLVVPTSLILEGFIVGAFIAIFFGKIKE